MDKFRALQVFVTVADQRGFAAAARSMNMDPGEIRRRNFVAPDAFPYATM